jgi:DNA-binding transcriptional ArsR family regulator
VSTASLARFGALIADQTRAELLSALLDGRAYTGGELARHAGVSPSTASEHLRKLCEAQLVTAEAQGRHRYFRLRGPKVAELLETLGSSTIDLPPASSCPPARRPAAGLAYARTCYDHLAGKLAVRIFDQLLTEGHLVDHGDHLELTAPGRALLTGLGADTSSAPQRRRPLVRGCLDWTERRRHLAGEAGSALLDAMFERRWIVRGSRPRSIRVTSSGHDEIPRAFRLTDLAQQDHRSRRGLLTS